MRTMDRFIHLLVALSTSAATASALAADPRVSTLPLRDPLPTSDTYFRLAAAKQVCNGGVFVETPALQSLRQQALDWFATQLPKGGDEAAAAQRSIDALKSGTVPDAVLADMRDAVAKTPPATNDMVCRNLDLSTRMKVVQYELYMSINKLPGAKPLADALADQRAISAEAAAALSRPSK